MIAAMMLPTTYPVLGIFRVMTRSRREARRLLGLLVAGFFCAWFASACSRMASTVRSRGSVAATCGLPQQAWMAGAAVLAAAGLFQFSALKYRCLEQCRTPLAFVSSRWHGARRHARPSGSASTMASSASACCWALMLCMFVVGTGQPRLDAHARRPDGDGEEPAGRREPAAADRARAARPRRPR
jgi:predicted metal-binding membrane protein